MSSEDYQNELSNNASVSKETSALEDFNVPANSNGTVFDEKINSEIPVDVDTMGVVIDKAPSLSTDDLEPESGEISANDINDLMADLMSSMDSDQSDDASELQKSVGADNTVQAFAKNASGLDEETIEAGRALEEYLNSPVENLINHPEMTASLGFEIPEIDDSNSVSSETVFNNMDFPSMPQMPDIPEVIEREHDTNDIAPESEETVDFSGFNLEPITVDNFDEHFSNNSSDLNSGLVFDDNGLNNADTVDSSELNYDAVGAVDSEVSNGNVVEELISEPNLDFDDEATVDFNNRVTDELDNRAAADSVIEEAGVPDSEATGIFDNEATDNSDNDITSNSIEQDAEEIAALTEAIAPDSENDTNDSASFSVDELEDMKKELAESIDDDDDDALGENDIEKMLANAQRAADDDSASEERESMSLDELLQTSNDGKAEDIGELLDKAERNEAVDEGISALLNNNDMPPIDIDSIPEGDEAPVDAKAAKKAEKLRLKEEKKEAKRKAKEAKAAEKLAKKQAKGKAKDNIIENVNENLNENVNEIVDSNTLSGDEQNSDMSEIEALLSETDLQDDANAEAATADGEQTDAVPEKEKKTNPIKAFFGKIADFLTEEDDDDEKSEIILSDENAAILDELNGEGKKGKKKKAKKGKKASGGDEESAEDLPEKKPPKKKKEKKLKKVDENEKPEPKISKKKITMVALVCIMFGVTIFLITYFTADYTVKITGRDAFKNEDYQTCYQSLYGKKLNDSDAVMYYRSECILKIQIWLREYEVYASEGSEVKALDSLIQSVDSYPALKDMSEEWGCLDKVEPVYGSIVDILQSKYGLSEEQAQAIAAIEDDVVYTRIVNAIVNGVNYEDALNYIYTDDISGNTPIEGIDTTAPTDDTEIPVEMDDLLPEEEGMSGNGFIEP